ncbi:BnaA01g24540D [Brassica napus]|uniref:BnaA01g24540D protein n=1 Tax=Brassica napus TaxID=3708 RepID=A0A078H9A9_BRANA|nr:BnaA01g24540D [Brassica napus]
MRRLCVCLKEWKKRRRRRRRRRRGDHVVQTLRRMLRCQKKKMKLLGVVLQHMVRNDVSTIRPWWRLLVIRGLCMSEKVEVACVFFEERYGS